MSEPTQVAAESGGEGVSVASEAAATPAAGYPFSVVKVLGTAWRVTKRNFVPFFVLTFVLQVPLFLIQRSSAPELAALSFFLGLVTNALTTAVVAYGVIMELAGSRPSTRACIATGFSQIGRVLRVTLLSALATFGAMLLFIVPGVVVFFMYFVVAPVAIVEGLGARAAMNRSRELTEGRKGDLFLIFAAGVAAAVAIELVAKYQLGPEAALVWRLFGSAFSTMFWAVTVAVTYVELRTLREGTHVPELATAFARIRS